MLRFGLVVRRADLRTFPTHLRVFRAPGDTDIDRFQEDALFPGTAVAVVHESRDDRWLFVVSERYAAWIERDKVAIGDREAVLDYARRGNALVVTGATARTVYTPENPAVSDVQLEMGVRVPLVADWPADRPLNGQVPYYGHVVELPVRHADGSLSFAPAMVPRSADVATGYLPHTRANVLRQAFKFLGERYGWGHAYNARDCSGFVSEIYRSFGILMPRNTEAQATTPALDTRVLEPGMPVAERLELLRETEVGDLLYMPGHVMLVIGHVDGEPYVIHDTAGVSLRTASGAVERLPLNGVVVTPLTPMLADATTSTIQHLTHIQRVGR
uniref:C40 family peptidase n=1 Tax=Luteimonas sp. 4-12 TaxID=2027406 RepID=UPI001E5B58EE|nr:MULTISPECIES: SH3 domain-containing protein [Luteimonas]